MSAQSGDEKFAVVDLGLKKGDVLVKRVKVKGGPVWKALPLLLSYSTDISRESRTSQVRNG